MRYTSTSLSSVSRDDVLRDFYNLGFSISDFNWVNGLNSGSETMLSFDAEHQAIVFTPKYEDIDGTITALPTGYY